MTMENMNIETMENINEMVADVATEIPDVEAAELAAAVEGASFLKNCAKCTIGAAVVAGIAYGAWKLWEKHKKAKAAKEEVEGDIEGQATEVDDEVDVESEE